MSNDLEARLRSNAVDVTPPSLDAMLDRATRSRRRTPWLVAAAAVLLAAAALVPLLVARHPATEQPTTRPVPATIVQNGVTLKRVGIGNWSNATLDPEDSRRFWVTSDQQPLGGYCHVTPQVFVTSQSATSITVTSATYVAVDGTPGGPCSGDATVWSPFLLTLHQPLGNRPLIDGGPGKVARPVDRPGPVPAATDLFGFTGGALGPSEIGGGITPQLVRTYRSHRGTITVTVDEAADDPKPSDVRQHVTVQGFSAAATWDTGFEQDIQLEWRVGKARRVWVTQTSNYSKSAPALTLSQLVQFADSLR
jgi:hypothetical protein